MAREKSKRLLASSADTARYKDFKFLKSWLLLVAIGHRWTAISAVDAPRHLIASVRDQWWPMVLAQF
jgi:hypothetical protein